MPDNDMDRQLWAEEARLEEEQKELVSERDVITRRLKEINLRLGQIDRRKDAIGTLLERNALKPIPPGDPVLPPGVSPESGMTIAVRQVLQANQPLRPSAIRDLLERSGFTGRSNLLINVHATLKRLERQGEVRVIQVHGRNAYKWIHQANSSDSG